AEMEAGRFRADLYYRINGLTLILPSLRERGDFASLTARMLKEMAPDRDVSLSDAITTAFAQYAWPGNLRQLANALRTACALLDEGETQIDWQHLPDDLVEEFKRPVTRAFNPVEIDPVRENLQDLSAAAIARTISASRGNMSEAARRLGISRNTLYRRLKGRASAPLV
ncbi:helix-turn-helix domain-containing protein, partial [Propionivibrio sp.]|uniref:helix-turn-helix domain-containing protein n=1 Tax=Propionivibrio sp. TaxID=2212460 RepID=UPI002626EE47